MGLWLSFTHYYKGLKKHRIIKNPVHKSKIFKKEKGKLYNF